MVVTEGKDTASLTGTISCSGSLVVTESRDTASLTGTLAIPGTIAATERTDVLRIVEGVTGIITGVLALTERYDVPWITDVAITSNVYNIYNSKWELVSYVKVGGSWKQIRFISIKKDGVWKLGA